MRGSSRVCVLHAYNYIYHSVIINATKKTEKKDGKKSWDSPPHSQEMQALNKQFGILHGVSSFLNLGTFIGSLVYGVTLSKRLS